MFCYKETTYEKLLQFWGNIKKYLLFKWQVCFQQNYYHISNTVERESPVGISLILYWHHSTLASSPVSSLFINITPASGVFLQFCHYILLLLLFQMLSLSHSTSPSICKTHLETFLLHWLSLALLLFLFNCYYLDL